MNMTPEQALQNLDRAASLAPLNRQDHVAVQQSIGVLAAFIRSRAADAPAVGPELDTPALAVDP